MRRRIMRLELEGRVEGFEGAKAGRWIGVEGYTQSGGLFTARSVREEGLS